MQDTKKFWLQFQTVVLTLPEVLYSTNEVQQWPCRQEVIPISVTRDLFSGKPSTGGAEDWPWDNLHAKHVLNPEQDPMH